MTSQMEMLEKSRRSTVDDCRTMDIRQYTDVRGDLSVIEGSSDIPFDIKRVYYLYNVPDAARGAHAHKALHQLLVAVHGSVEVTVDDGSRQRTFLLDNKNQGLYVVPGLWRTLNHFTPDNVTLVLASEHYAPDDYIRDYAEFRQFKQE